MITLMRRFFILMTVFVLIPGCAYVNPLVEDFNIISIPQERTLGEQSAAEVAKQMTIVTDPALTSRVRKIGSRLVAALPDRQFDYAFSVVQDNTPNAFTIPGGKIYVHTGLLKFAGDDDELAGVIAHEVGHAYDRHPAKGMSRAYGVDYLSKLIFKGSQSQLKTLALQFAAGGLLSHYSRDEELRADSIGYQLAVKAGYRTDGLIRFFKKLMTLESKGTSIPFLASHPPTPERIARLQAMSQQGIAVPQNTFR